MSFFGGDHTKSHYSVQLLYNAFKGETTVQRRDRRCVEWATINLYDPNFRKTKYWQFTNGDLKAKRYAQKRAEQYARDITDNTGVIVEVVEGSFL
jgi:hypothetical protein